MPNCSTRVEDTNVAATPMKAHIPLNPPMIDGCKPAEIFKKKNHEPAIMIPKNYSPTLK